MLKSKENAKEVNIMSVFLVAYDTKNEVSSREHQLMQKAIQRGCQSYDSIKIWPTAWLIDSDDTALEIRNSVKSSVRELREEFKQLSEITVYVHKMARNNWATLNGGQIADWLKNQRNEQDYRHASYI